MIVVVVVVAVTLFFVLSLRTDMSLPTQEVMFKTIVN